MQPFREPAADRDTSAVDRELDAMLAAAQARARRNRTWMGLALGGVALLAVSPFLFMMGRMGLETLERGREARARRVSAAERPAAEEALRAARATVARRRTAFESATSPAALEALVPALGRCPFSLGAPIGNAATAYVTHGSIDGNYFGRWQLTRIDARGAKTARSRVAPDLLLLRGAADGTSAGASTLDAFEAALAKGTAEKQELEAVRRLANASEAGLDVLFRVDEERAPVPAPGLSAGYDGGFVTGRAYLYDRPSGRVACVADVDASSSPSVDVRYVTQGLLDTSRTNALRAALARDLEVQTRVAISRGLRVAVTRASGASEARLGETGPRGSAEGD